MARKKKSHKQNAGKKSHKQNANKKSDHKRNSPKDNHTPARSIKVEFSDESVTSFGGLALSDRLAMRLGLWNVMEKYLPQRRGEFSWMDIVRSSVGGLLSGSRGTIACEDVREDQALQKLLSIPGAPSESTFWRGLEFFGSGRQLVRMGRCAREWCRRVLDRTNMKDLKYYGFIPMFGDGTLLEGSARREGTKFIKDKGRGLMLSTWFIGPVLASQELAGAGAGEARGLRRGLRDVLHDVIDPLGFRSRALVLLDSLHGDGPTCSRLEKENLKYVIGANKLKETERLLAERCESEWIEQGARAEMGWAESAVCVCKLQCADWPEPRLLVGRRWRRDGDLPGIYHYAGVLTDLEPADVSHMRNEGVNFAEAIWKLYDGKAGMENYFKDYLEDLSGHHPPCQELSRNRGYYALLGFAYTLARGVDLLGAWGDDDRGGQVRQDGAPRKRPRPRRMRFWRIRRLFFSLPGRVFRHARQVRVQLLGVSQKVREQFEACFLRLSRC